MCLSVPAKVIEVSGLRGRAEMAGNVISIDLSLLPDVKPGEFVLVHAGFVLERYRSEDAQEILGIFREVAEAMEREDAEAVAGGNAKETRE